MAAQSLRSRPDRGRALFAVGLGQSGRAAARGAADGGHRRLKAGRVQGAMGQGHGVSSSVKLVRFRPVWVRAV